jgi:hypothetical protein
MEGHRCLSEIFTTERAGAWPFALHKSNLIGTKIPNIQRAPNCFALNINFAKKPNNHLSCHDFTGRQRVIIGRFFPGRYGCSGSSEVAGIDG